jgi:hypothetical protein
MRHSTLTECSACGAHDRRYAAAFDWRDTSRSSFKPDLYYNDTYGLPQGEAPTVYQRVPQVLNMAVNSWLRNTLGERVRQRGGGRSRVRVAACAGLPSSHARVPFCASQPVCSALVPFLPPHTPAHARTCARAHAGPSYSAELIGVMETPKMETKVNLDFSALLGPLFFTWVIQMLLPVL